MMHVRRPNWTLSYAYTTPDLFESGFKPFKGNVSGPRYFSSYDGKRWENIEYETNLKQHQKPHRNA